jgi:hypothetical protein
MEKIKGIECFSKTSWYVVFTTRQARTAAKNKSIKLYEKDFALESLEYKRTKVNYTWVRIYGYPLDSDSSFLQKTSTLYGELNCLTYEMDGRLQIKTGVKIAQFSSLKGNIPSFIHVRKHRVRTAYRGQTKTCQNCHQAGQDNVWPERCVNSAGDQARRRGTARSVYVSTASERGMKRTDAQNMLKNTQGWVSQWVGKPTKQQPI